MQVDGGADSTTEEEEVGVISGEVVEGAVDGVDTPWFGCGVADVRC